MRPGNDPLSVRRERSCTHHVRVTGERAHLPTHRHPEQSQDKPAAISHKNNPTSPLPSKHLKNTAHLVSGRSVPDLHEGVIRPADDPLSVRRESDRVYRRCLTAQVAHLPTHPLFRPLPTQRLHETRSNTPTPHHPQLAQSSSQRLARLPNIVKSPLLQETCQKVASYSKVSQNSS